MIYRLLPLLLFVGCVEISGKAIPMERGAGHGFVDVEIEGVRVRCMVDTGADVLYVVPWLVPDAREGQLFYLDKIHYGPVTQRDVPTVVLDQEIFNAIGRRVPGQVDCLLGFTILPESGVIDFASETLWSMPSPRWEPEDTVERIDIVPVMVWPFPMGRATFGGGTEVTSLLNTSALLPVLRTWVFDELVDPPPTTPASVVTEDGTIEAHLTDLPISMRGEAGVTVEVLVYDSPELDFLEEALFTELDAVIGAEYLLQHAFSWDRLRGELTLFPYSSEVRTALLAEYDEQLENP